MVWAVHVVDQIRRNQWFLGAMLRDSYLPNVELRPSEV